MFVFLKTAKRTGIWGYYLGRMISETQNDLQTRKIKKREIWTLEVFQKQLHIGCEFLSPPVNMVNQLFLSVLKWGLYHSIYNLLFK